MPKHFVPHAVTIVFPDDESMVFDTFDDYLLWSESKEDTLIKKAYITQEIILQDSTDKSRGYKLIPVKRGEQ